MGDLLAADVELAGMYRECATRHRGLTEWAHKVSRQPGKVYDKSATQP